MTEQSFRGISTLSFKKGKKCNPCVRYNLSPHVSRRSVRSGLPEMPWVARRQYLSRGQLHL